MESTEPKLSEKEITTVRQVVGRLLYYTRAIDNNLVMSLNTIAVQQDKATTNTRALIIHLLRYCATYPDATLTYSASDMILHIHTDASFLSEPEAKSRAGVFFYPTKLT